MNTKKFNILTISFILISLCIVALPIIIIDPFFHYHAPLDGHGYKISNERYQNNGIVRNFEYDAIITGTSMTENFKTSEMDALFNVKSIKVPYAGGEYKEISDNLKVALKKHDIRFVIWGIDLNGLIHDRNALFHGIRDANYQYPWYLIDRNPFNDVSYLFNKAILLNSIDIYKDSSNENTSFDEAYYWGDARIFGREAILSTYEPPDHMSDIERVLTDEEIEIEIGNINQNIIELAKNYPDTKFYLFLPPYSICWWNSVVYGGQLNFYLDALKIEFEELLKYDNIKLYAFWNNEEIVCDLNNFRDSLHYSADVNSKILQWMAEEDKQYLITKGNYLEYLDELRNFYSNYDYESIYE